MGEPIRTLLRIEAAAETPDAPGVVNVTAVLPGWRATSRVYFPISAVSGPVPGTLFELLQPGRRLYCKANLAAETADDLNPSDFEYVPSALGDNLLEIHQAREGKKRTRVR